MKTGAARAIKGQPRPVKPVAQVGSPQKSLAGPRARSPARAEQQLPRTPVKRFTVMRKAPLKPIGDAEKPPVPPPDARTSPRPQKEAIQKYQRERAQQERSREPSIQNLGSPGSSRFHAEFLEKLKICRMPCSFENDAESELEMIRKRTALAQVLTWLAETDDCFEKISAEEADKLFEMIERNIFRERKQIPATELFYEVPSPLMFEKAWPHLEVVYLMLFRILCLVPFDRHFDRRFLDLIFEQFATPSLEERMELIRFVKGYFILHVNERPYVIDKITTMIEQHLSTHDRPFQVAGCLPLLVSISQVEEEGLDWFYKLVRHYVLPLIGDTFVFYYSIPLKIILDLYAFEQPKHAAEVIDRILAYWPRQNTQKMCIYTSMMMEYLPYMTKDLVSKYVPQIFKLMAENCNAPSPRLAEASFQIFLVPYFDQIMKDNCSKILGIMVPAVSKCMNEHWEDSIRDIAGLCMSIMEKFNADTVRKLSAQKQDPKAQRDKEIESWKKIIASAVVNDSSIKGDRLSQKVRHVYNIRTLESATRDVAVAASR